jgi:tRNA pseudouridine38-40 synthase
LVVEYDGASFSGWQTQVNQKTVQGELENAIAIYCNALKKKQNVKSEHQIYVQGSGRTDAGVHAKAQVANFYWPDNLPLDVWELRHSLNGITCAGLHVLSAEKVAEDFDSRRSAHIKCYRYNILLKHGKSGLYGAHYWCVPQTLDIAKIIEASKYFVGVHDFSSFRAKDCNANSTTRSILASEIVRESADTLSYLIVGKGFLKQMVRAIAGTLVEVGLGKKSPHDIPEIIGRKERVAAGQTAPAHGLCLEWVRYDERFNFYS